MKPSRAALAITGACCASLLACPLSSGPKPAKHELQGSLVEYMRFGYDEARYEQSQGSSDFAIVFVRYRGEDPDGGTPAGEDVPLKVTVRASLLSPTELETLDFDLARDAGNTGADQLGQLSRNVLNDPRRAFTTIQRGGVKMARLPVAPGETTTGSFHVTFDPGIDFSSGRTLFGDFTAAVP